MKTIQEINYKISFRLLNIKVDGQYNIDENIIIRGLSKQEILKKYPLDKRLFNLPALGESFWFEHNAEVVFNFNGSKEDIENAIQIKATNQLENSILNAFILSGLFRNQYPYATHLALESSYRTINAIQGFNGMRFDPFLISKTEIEEIVKSYKIIEEANKDNVLFTAFDRYIVAKQKEFQHTYKVNYPNWDKLVDYTIAFETLFLTPVEQELSYRFKLNGTSLISRIDNIDKRIIFNALGDLYKLRSKIVHGGNSDSILKPARKLVNTLSLNTENHEHDIGILIIICNRLDEWFYKIFAYLINLNIEIRPYNKTGIWEDWLWDNK